MTRFCGPETTSRLGSILGCYMLCNPIPALNMGEGCYIYWYQSYDLVDSKINVAYLSLSIYSIYKL